MWWRGFLGRLFAHPAWHCIMILVGINLIVSRESLIRVLEGCFIAVVGTVNLAQFVPSRLRQRRPGGS